MFFTKTSRKIFIFKTRRTRRSFSSNFFFSSLSQEEKTFNDFKNKTLTHLITEWCLSDSRFQSHWWAYDRRGNFPILEWVTNKFSVLFELSQFSLWFFFLFFLLSFDLFLPTAKVLVGINDEPFYVLRLILLEKNSHKLFRFYSRRQIWLSERHQTIKSSRIFFFISSAVNINNPLNTLCFLKALQT